MTNENKDWTIMVYMAGDNNLSENMAFSLDALTDINRKMTKTARTKVNLLAFFDSASTTAPTQYIDFSDRNIVRYAVSSKDMYYPRPVNSEKATIDPENSGSAYSILNFINWCIHVQGRVASNYIIVFSGHSFGFYGQGLLGDRSSGGYLTLRSFRWALEEAVRQYFANDKIALVGFDSCEMSMLEVGYELKDVARTIVASEGNLPNYGWGYASMLREFIADPSRFLNSGNEFLTLRGFDLSFVGDEKEMDEVTAAASFVYAFIDYQRKVAIGGRSVDISAWDLSKIEALAKSVGELGDVLLEKLGIDRLIDKKEIDDEETIIFNNLKDLLLASHMRCQTFLHEQAVDIGDFCECLKFGCLQLEKEMEYFGKSAQPYADVRTKCELVQTSLDECILLSGFCGDEFQFSKGISLYFPWTALTYLLTSEVYRNLQFVSGDLSHEGRPRFTLTSDGNLGSQDAKGPGRRWDDFLYYYLFFVTLRRTIAKQATSPAAYDKLKNGSVSDGDWGMVRENWRLGTKENWLAGTRENWRLGTRENWLTGTRENWLLGTRENWLAGTKEMTDAFLDSFDKFKNNQLDWSVSGIGGLVTYIDPETNETKVARMEEQTAEANG